MADACCLGAFVGPLPAADLAAGPGHSLGVRSVWGRLTSAEPGEDYLAILARHSKASNADDYRRGRVRGRCSCRGEHRGRLANLARLYWYTVEFGLIRTTHGLKAYGAGILSSAAELKHAIEGENVMHLPFEPVRVMRTAYEIDKLQPAYFVLDNFRELFAAANLDFAPIYRELTGLPEIPVGCT